MWNIFRRLNERILPHGFCLCQQMSRSLLPKTANKIEFVLEHLLYVHIFSSIYWYLLMSEY